jgi:hypothetical protein
MQDNSRQINICDIYVIVVVVLVFVDKSRTNIVSSPSSVRNYLNQYPKCYYIFMLGERLHNKKYTSFF